MGWKWHLFSVMQIFKTLLFCITQTDLHCRAPAAAAWGQQSCCHTGTGAEPHPAPGQVCGGAERAAKVMRHREVLQLATGGTQSGPPHPTPPPCWNGGPGSVLRPPERDQEHRPDPPRPGNWFPREN